jgi:hypothetical protein|nr:hypothetical protein [Pseudomonas moraviensis]
MNQLVIEDDAGEYRLTAAEFQQQAAMPAAVEWFANLGNSRTYPNDLEDFCSFVGFRSFVRRSRSHARLVRPVADRSHYPSRTGGVAKPVQPSAGKQCGGQLHPRHGIKWPKIDTNR